MKNNTQPALKERIEKALEDFTKGRASMHVPPLDTDVDVVLAECSDRLSELKARCAALAAENAMLKQRTQQLIDIISNTDNDYCMCGSAMKDHVHSGCGYPTGMFDYYYNQWLESDNKTPATDAFLAEVRAQGVDEFLRGSQLPYQIATVLADYDNVDDATLQTVIWSGQPPEPDGDVWHLEYVSRGNAIVRAVLKELRKGVQS
ncbi:hypothetical protein [Escherichia coli]|uniref:hypothetical protein n=1 Tax=Escherichia coli TaxID=562 RepID=UPI00207BE761|nr:hypothetical protein [Escherichia coli]